LYVFARGEKKAATSCERAGASAAGADF